MNDKYLLRPGVSSGSATRSLMELATRAGNLVSASGFGQLFNGYLTWVEDAEGLLASLFVSPEVWKELYTDRYWHLRELANGRPVRPFPLIGNEANRQRERLEEIADYLEQAQLQFEVPETCEVVMPDTNVVAHYRRYNEIDWTSLANSPLVRIVIPLLVIDQLDELSYKSREGGSRAADVLRALQNLRGEAPPEEPIEVRSGTTLQLLVDPPGHERRTNADDEILTRAEYLNSLVGGRVLVATGDLGMQLRAKGRGLRILNLPDELRIPQ